MSSQYDLQHKPNSASPAEVRKNRKKLIIIPIVIIFAFVAGFMLWPSHISRQEAQEIAVSHVGGGAANRAERDFERFQRTWYVEVFHNGLIHEVYVSMRTGEIIRMEVDRWD